MSDTTTYELPDANDLLAGGGAKSAQFPEIGTVVKGEVLDFATRQQRDFDTGKPLFYDDGKPRLQIVVQVQTDERDPDVEDDDGIRALYLKGQLLQAAREATRRHRGLAQGGRIGVKYYADGDAPRKGANPQKLYKVEYAPPTKRIDLDGTNGGRDEPLI